MSFKEKLVALQKEHAETNYRLSKAIGVHQTTIRNWQNGVVPQLEHRALLAKHYGVTEEELMGDPLEEE